MQDLRYTLDKSDGNEIVVSPAAYALGLALLLFLANLILFVIDCLLPLGLGAFIALHIGGTFSITTGYALRNVRFVQATQTSYHCYPIVINLPKRKGTGRWAIVNTPQKGPYKVYFVQDETGKDGQATNHTYQHYIWAKFAAYMWVSWGAKPTA